jgi:hypothetical protein
MRCIAAALVVALTAPQAASAQADTSAWITPASFGERFGVLLGISTGNPRIVSGIKRRPVNLVAVRGSWLITGSHDNGLEYVAEVVPVFVTKTNPTNVEGTVTTTGTQLATLGTTFGAGFMPVGIRALLGVSRDVRFTVESGGGLLLFTHPAPVEASRKVNFMAVAGAGLEVDLGQGASVMGGYRFLHYSNARSANLNPGVDNSIFYLGLLVHGRR